MVIGQRLASVPTLESEKFEAALADQKWLLEETHRSALSKLSMQVAEIEALRQQLVEQGTLFTEQLSQQLVEHQAEVASLKRVHVAEIHALQRALESSDTQLASLEQHVLRCAGEVSKVHEDMQRLALEAHDGKSKVAPCSLLQQFQMRREKAEALRAAERLEASLVAANTKI